MTPDDVERIRVRALPSWRPDLRCADCLGPPTCPQLGDVVWWRAWRAHPAKAARRCNCAEWDAMRLPKRLESRVAVGPDMHWGRCDLARPTRRELLCLECVEERLERHLTLEDLQACVGNYYTAVLAARLAPAMVLRVSGGAATPEVMERLRDQLGSANLDRLRMLATPTAMDLAADPHRTPPVAECGHGVEFDERAAQGLQASEIRRRWPRLDGPCPLGCGYSGIAYASRAHYVCGDW